MQHLCQRDPRWAGKKIGASWLTIGRFGCAITGISMISDLFGRYMAPDTIAMHEDWFTRKGLVMWNELRIPSVSFRWRQYGRNDVKIMESIRTPNHACLLEVGNGSHWVVAVRKMLLKNDYVIVDPWTGRTGAACGDYGNITGSAHFVKS